MIDKKWKWIAMDVDKEWYLHSIRPKRSMTEWVGTNDGGGFLITRAVGPYSGSWKDSLHEIIHREDGSIEFRKARPELKRDDKVWVRDTDKDSWKPRHFAGWGADGRIITWCDGGTSFSRPAVDYEPTSWEYYKLPDECE